MKLRTEIDFDPISPFLHVPGNPLESCMDDICKDAMAAHALMQAMEVLAEEFHKAGISGMVGTSVIAEIDRRADELMREWGMEVGE